MRFLDVGRSTGFGFDSKELNSKTVPVAVQETSIDKPELGQTWDLKAFVDHQVALGTERLYEQAIALLDEKLLHLIMQHTNGNRVRAAKLLGITRTSLRRKMNGTLKAELATDSSGEQRPDDQHA